MMAPANENIASGLVKEGDSLYMLLFDCHDDEKHWIFSSMGKLAEFVADEWPDEFDEADNDTDSPDQMAWFLAASEEEQFEFINSFLDDVWVYKMKLDSTTAAEDTEEPDLDPYEPDNAE